jgi:hypothetical protein
MKGKLALTAQFLVLYVVAVTFLGCGWPLAVHPDNPRYFSDAGGKAIYLTGSHVHNNLVDHSERPIFDYGSYLAFLQQHNHNFIRMWTWEHARVPRPNNTWLEFDPLPYERTGPDIAADGKLKFDLTKFNQVYFDRLRSRIMAAGELGIYVSVMLFEGWGIVGYDTRMGEGSAFKAWDGHPFNITNNMNEIDGDLNKDRMGFEIHTLSAPAITLVQEAYVRKVIDTLNDLDNVLYEISNESRKESVMWQYHMINYIRAYEKTKPKQHPLVMTFLWDGPGDGGKGDNAELFQSPADAIAPGRGVNGEYASNPPAADGRKVIISDTDHIGMEGSSAQWVWKSFLRGFNPIHMDGYGSAAPTPEGESARRNMGYTRSYAERINLAAMTPRPDLCSSTFCLVNPGFEYLVYLPSGPQQASPSVKVDLSASSGVLNVEWFSLAEGKTVHAEKSHGGSSFDFTAPFDGDAVLFISKSQ